MARLRTAAGESPLALRFTFRSRLRLVRRKWTRAAADSAVASARRGRNGGLLTLRPLTLSVKGQREISAAHSRESAYEEIGVAGATLVIAPSPLAGEGNSMLPQTMMDEGLPLATPHPFEIVATPLCPLLQGERSKVTSSRILLKISSLNRGQSGL